MSAAPSQPVVSSRDPIGIALRVAIVLLTLATAYFHSTLGGLLFTLNALGYLFYAVMMVLPIAIVARYRWLVIGARFTMAYIDKAVEIGLVVALLVEMWRYDGGPIEALRRTVQLGLTIVRMPFASRSDA